MIPVYVRDANEGEGSLLGDFEPHHIPQLVQSFKDYPTYAHGGECTFTGAQYVCNDDCSYFEIAVEELQSG